MTALDRPLGAPGATLIAPARAVAGLLASRKARLLLRFPVVSLSRLAERALRGLLFHDAPRSTRKAQSPASQTDPSEGDAVYDVFQQSAVHSHTLPIMSYRPNGLAR
jgi:hypothetical protein